MSLHNRGSKGKAVVFKYDFEPLNCPTSRLVAYLRKRQRIFRVTDYFSQGPSAGNRCQVCELNRIKCVVSNTVNPSLDPFNIKVSFGEWKSRANCFRQQLACYIRTFRVHLNWFFRQQTLWFDNLRGSTLYLNITNLMFWENVTASISKRLSTKQNYLIPDLTLKEYSVFESFIYDHVSLYYIDRPTQVTSF